MPDPCGSSSISLPLYHHLFLYRPTCGNVGALRDHLTPHLFVSPSVCLFISSLHLSQNPSTNNSGGLSSSFRASLRSSVCLHARPRRVVIGLSVCLLVCIYVVPVRSLCVCDVTNISCNYNNSH